MSLRELIYQNRVLTVFDRYLTEFSAQKSRADSIATLARQQPDLGLEIPDFPAKTWATLRTAGLLPPSRAAIPYSLRQDGINRPVPNAVFKVPTGGGKTYLAVAALSRIFGRYLGKNTGFVLWVVPNEAIYSQTKRQLADRQHPYREMLDKTAAGRVKLLEKADRLDARDLESQLCVMLLMLPSANRQTRESLKMFRDRGDVHGFFPPEGDMDTHRLALEQTPNLDAYGKAGEAGAFWPLVKDSLGNALRLIRPVVVMDEGHKAISELALATLYGFNPCFVLELTATPKDVAAKGGAKPQSARHANILVEVLGIEVDKERNRLAQYAGGRAGSPQPAEYRSPELLRRRRALYPPDPAGASGAHRQGTARQRPYSRARRQRVAHNIGTGRGGNCDQDRRHQ